MWFGEGNEKQPAPAEPNRVQKVRGCAGDGCQLHWRVSAPTRQSTSAAKCNSHAVTTALVSLCALCSAGLGAGWVWHRPCPLVPLLGMASFKSSYTCIPYTCTAALHRRELHWPCACMCAVNAEEDLGVSAASPQDQWDMCGGLQGENNAHQCRPSDCQEFGECQHCLRAFVHL